MARFIEYVKRIYQLIDYYPDAATTAIILVSSFVQIVTGNGLKLLLFALFCMLLSLIVSLPTNIIIKNLLKTARPENYNKTKDSLFKDSFPSFHSQFAAGEATTFITIIALYSPQNIVLLATILAVITAGFSSLVVAWSRVSLSLHYPHDAIGGIVLGVFLGFLLPYIVAPLLWNKISITWLISGSAIFFISLYLLSRSQRA